MPRRCSNSLPRFFGRLWLRRPQAMAHHSICRLGFSFVLLLQGCGNGSSSRDLLPRLASCLAEVRATTSQNFTSPCSTLHVSKLSGITLAQLKSTLGAPGISSDDYVYVPKDPR